MKSLREIIEEVCKANPFMDKKALFKAVMDKIKKECFLLGEELEATENELAQRLSNY